MGGTGKSSLERNLTSTNQINPGCQPASHYATAHSFSSAELDVFSPWASIEANVPIPLPNVVTATWSFGHSDRIPT